MYRSTENRVLGGVAGGLAEELNIDAWIVRLIFVVLVVTWISPILYIVFWIALPERDPQFTFAEASTGNDFPDRSDKKENTNHQSFSADLSSDEDTPKESVKPENENIMSDKKDDNKGSIIAGVVLISLGILFLLDKLLPRFDFSDFWPLILVVTGGILIWNGFQKKSS